VAEGFFSIPSIRWIDEGVLYIVSQFTFGSIPAQIPDYSPTELSHTTVLVVTYLAAIYRHYHSSEDQEPIFSGHIREARREAL